MHTVEYRPDENSGKICLLCEVNLVRDLRGVGVVGPRVFRGVRPVRHGSYACNCAMSFGRVGRRTKMKEGTLGLDGRNRGGSEVYKPTREPN